MNLTRVRDDIDKINDLKCDIDVYKYVIGPCGEHGVIGSKVFWGIQRACPIAHFVKEELSAT